MVLPPEQQGDDQQQNGVADVKRSTRDNYFETTLYLGQIGEQNVVVKFDWSPAERQTRDDPGCPESVDVTEVLLWGLDVLEHMSKGDVADLEEEILCADRDDGC